MIRWLFGGGPIVLSLMAIMAGSAVHGASSVDCRSSEDCASSSYCSGPCAHEKELENRTFLLLWDLQIFFARPSDEHHLQVDKLKLWPDRLDHKYSWADSEHHRNKVSWISAFANDFDHDGEHEVVLAFKEEQGRLQVVLMSETGNDVKWNKNHTPDKKNYQIFEDHDRKGKIGPISVAAGNVDTSTPDDEIVVALQGDSGATQVLVLPRSLKGKDDVTLASWVDSDRARKTADNLTVRVADLEGDGTADQIVLALRDKDGKMQILIFGYEGKNLPLSVTSWCRGSEVFGGKVLSHLPQGALDMEVGDLDGDFQDEILVSYVEGQRYQGRLKVLLLEYDAPTDDAPARPGDADPICRPGSQGTGQGLHVAAEWLSEAPGLDSVSSSFAGTGDIDGDGRDEAVTFFQVTKSRSWKKDDELRILTLSYDRKTRGLSLRGSWSEKASKNKVGHWLPNDLAVGDLNRDGIAEIVPLYIFGAYVHSMDYNGHDVTRLKLNVLSEGQDADYGLKSLATYEQAATDQSELSRHNIHSSAWAALALGDSYRESYYAKPTGACCAADMYQMRLVLYTPPSWISDSRTTTVSYQTQESQGTTAGRSDAANWSSSITVGAGLTLPKGLAQIGGSVTRDMRSAETYSRTYGRQLAIARPYFANKDMLVFDELGYDCYDYTVIQKKETAQDQQGFPARGCFMSGLRQTHNPDIDGWTRMKEPTADDGLDEKIMAASWFPMARPWIRANLALGRKVSLSSAPGCDPKNTVDGRLGAPCSTSAASVSGPTWWQVDLGSTQSVSSVVLWTAARTDPELANLFIYIGDLAEPSLPKPDPHDPGTGWSFFPTTVPRAIEIAAAGEGRYVRIQSSATHQRLDIDEVQVLGPPPSKAPEVADFPRAVRSHTDESMQVTPQSGEPFLVLGHYIWTDPQPTMMSSNEAGKGWTFSGSSAFGQSTNLSWGSNHTIGGSFRLLPVSVSGGSSWGFNSGSSTTYNLSQVKTIDSKIGPRPSNDLPPTAPYCFKGYLYSTWLLTSGGVLQTYVVADSIVPAIEDLSACKGLP